jgi:hypothetical protein
MSLYTDCLAAGIPWANHYSDLYIPATAQTRELLNKRGLTATTFINQVEGGIWLDVPFAYDPYWQSKGGES